MGIVKVFHVEGFGWAVPQRRRVFAAVTVRDSPGYSLFLGGAVIGNGIRPSESLPANRALKSDLGTEQSVVTLHPCCAQGEHAGS